MLMLLLACARPGSVYGQVADARTGLPISSLEVAWVRDGTDSCARRATHTDASGAYHLDGICPGAAYHLVLNDPDWWGEFPELTADESGRHMDLRLWRIPAVAGVYVLKDAQLQLLKTQTAVDRLPLLDKGEQLRFPLEIPGHLPRIDGDSLLVLAGAVTEALQFEPLLPGGAMQFGSRDAPQAVGAWFYIGTRVLGPNQLEPAVAAPDPGQVTSVGAGERVARYLNGRALAAGRYALGAADAKRVYLLDFGSAP